MADLLRSGSTMLNIACPVCNNPIFRNKDGKTFCPTCNREVLMVNKKTYQNGTMISRDFTNKDLDNNSEKEQNDILTKLKIVIYEKLDELIQELIKETHIGDIEVYSRILLNFLELIAKIQSQNE
ncbi:MAG: Sjogren's syndrome/scleroderma autoantigen 1 family protein [Promethearchaeota archaeon]